MFGEPCPPPISLPRSTGCCSSLLPWRYFRMRLDHKFFPNHMDTFWLVSLTTFTQTLTHSHRQRHTYHNITWHNFVVGLWMNWSGLLGQCPTEWPACLSRYMCSLSLFHYSEYLVTAIINPRSLSLDSFLLNHSVEYTVAAVSSWVEFTIEKLTVPGLSLPKWCSVPFISVEMAIE